LLARLRKSLDEGNRCPDWGCMKSIVKEQTQIYSMCCKYSFTKPFDQNSQNYKGNFNKARLFAVVLQSWSPAFRAGLQCCNERR